MPKGSKSCPVCGKVTGPRTYVCAQCHTPFKFGDKAKVKPEQAKLISVKKTAARGDVSGLKSLFHEVIDDKHEINISKSFYDGTLRTFESEDGNFRIRYAKTCMGVDLKLLNGGRFRLLRKKNDGWLPLGSRRQPGYKTFIRAIKAYVNIQLKLKHNRKDIHPRLRKYLNATTA